VRRRKAAAVAAALMVGVAAACGFAAPLDPATIAGPGALTIVTVEVAAADVVRRLNERAGDKASTQARIPRPTDISVDAPDGKSHLVKGVRPE
jgi:hypothetical protein